MAANVFAAMPPLFQGFNIREDAKALPFGTIDVQGSTSLPPAAIMLGKGIPDLVEVDEFIAWIGHGPRIAHEQPLQYSRSSQLGRDGVQQRGVRGDAFGSRVPYDVTSWVSKDNIGLTNGFRTQHRAHTDGHVLSSPLMLVDARPLKRGRAMHLRLSYQENRSNMRLNPSRKVFGHGVLRDGQGRNDSAILNDKVILSVGIAVRCLKAAYWLVHPLQLGAVWHHYLSARLTLPLSCGPQATTPGATQKACAVGRQLLWVVRPRPELGLSPPCPLPDH
jgi:hypothetical protein